MSSVNDSMNRPLSAAVNSDIYNETLANEKFNPYIEDVFSLGMTIL